MTNATAAATAPRRATLTATRGLPGSGKTTWAKEQGQLRANRDDIRLTLFGGRTGERLDEEMVTRVQVNNGDF